MEKVAGLLAESNGRKKNMVCTFYFVTTATLCVYILLDSVCLCVRCLTQFQHCLPADMTVLFLTLFNFTLLFIS
jgi:hypothetical protein